MDFCNWCEGKERSAQLTAQGKSGGVCPKHRVEYLRQLAEELKRRRGVSTE